MLPQRKTVRLKSYDYNTPGYYFLTLCTEGKRKIFCEIVGTGLLDGPRIRLSEFGQIADARLRFMAGFYEDIELEKYVIMPNHIHLLIHINGTKEPNSETNAANSRISKFVGTFKRFCNRKYGTNVCQSRSHDHVIRGEEDYLKIWQYIEENPLRWQDDCFFVE